MDPRQIPDTPEILTATVGSYSPFDWLAALVAGRDRFLGRS